MFTIALRLPIRVQISECSILNLYDCIYTFKIFTKPKDEISLFLLGTKTTDNRLNGEYGGYEHISHALEMNAMSWDILKYIQKNIDPPSDEITGDWLDAIVVAMDYFKSLEYVTLNISYHFKFLLFVGFGASFFQIQKLLKENSAFHNIHDRCEFR